MLPFKYQIDSIHLLHKNTTLFVDPWSYFWQ